MRLQAKLITRQGYYFQLRLADPQMTRLRGVLYLFIDLRRANTTGTLMLEIVSHISLMAVQALPPVLKGISLFWQNIFPV